MIISGDLMRRKIKQSEQSKRRQNLVEHTIRWIATKPWLRSATGYTKAYHVNTDVEELDFFRRYFNDAAEVIEQHFGKGYFGLRLEWGFVQRHGEDVKALRVRESPGGHEGLLDYLAETNQTLTRKPPPSLSDEERALRMAARHRLNQVVARWKEGQRPPEEPVSFLFTGLYNFRPDAPPEPAVESYGPVDWKFMSDFLFLIRIPEKDFEYQAKAYDGWWNRRGRKKVASQITRSRIAPFS
jgi:hypothetical protein